MENDGHSNFTPGNSWEVDIVLNKKEVLQGKESALVTASLYYDN